MRHGGKIGKLIVNALSKPDLTARSVPVEDDLDARWRVIEVAGCLAFFRFADPQRGEDPTFRYVGVVLGEQDWRSKRLAEVRLAARGTAGELREGGDV